MDVNEFDYDLSASAIAQRPLDERDASRHVAGSIARLVRGRIKLSANFQICCAEAN